eukprot:Ihof_evm12s21 gene=Ihof_evmTU12s21
MSKDAIIICMDVGPSMGSSFPSNNTSIDTYLTMGLEVVKKMIVHRLSFARNDEMGLVLFGTEDTKNQLTEGSTGEYSHVTVAKNLNKVNLDLLRFVETIVPGPVNGDYMDALVVAMDLLLARVSGKVSYKPRLFIITNGQSAINWEDEQVNQIISGVKEKGISVEVIGIDIETEPNEEIKKRNFDIFKRICAYEPMKFEDALENVNQFRSKAVRQTPTYRGTLDFGSQLKIPIYSFIRVKETKPESFTNISKLATDKTDRPAKIQLERIYKKLDDDTEVEQGERIHGYKYGADLVPVTPEDEDNMKLCTDKSMKVIGFAEYHEVPRHMFMDDVSTLVPPPNDNVAMRAFTAFVHALDETRTVGIVRFVARDKAEEYKAFQPKLLVNPQINHFFECVRARALDANASVPTINPELVSMYDIPPDVKANASIPLAEFIAACPLTIVEKNCKRGIANEQWGTLGDLDLGLDENKKIKQQRIETKEKVDNITSIA